MRHVMAHFLVIPTPINAIPLHVMLARSMNSIFLVVIFYEYEFKVISRLML